MFKRLSTLSIQRRFQMFLGTIIFIFVMVVFFFIYAISVMQHYRDYNTLTDKVMIEYLKVRRNEQLFLLHYTQDLEFFETGQNRYLERHGNSFKRLNEIITELHDNSISKQLAIEADIEKLKNRAINYSNIFDQMTKKIAERGFDTYGIVGMIKKEADRIYNEYDNPYIREYILILQQYQKDYMLNNNQTSYQEFMNMYEGITKYSNLDSVLPRRTKDRFRRSLESYKDMFENLSRVNKEIGQSSDEGLNGELSREIRQLDPELDALTEKIEKERNTIVQRTFIYIYVFVALMVILMAWIVWRFSNSITRPIYGLRKYITPLAKGNLPENIQEFRTAEELQQMGNAINDLIIGLKKTTQFAHEIGEGIYDTDFEPLSEKDTLGNSLLEMRTNLYQAKEEEMKQQIQADQRKWANEGLNLFSEILRKKSDNIKEISYEILSSLVKYLKANQGGMFMYNDTDKNDLHLELLAAFAYDRNRYYEHKIKLKEGLIGTCAIEKQTIHLVNLPDDYLTITSGLGGASPRNLLVVPMKVEEQIFGVVELASFNQFEQHEIEFVERVSETIASSLSVTKINNRTAQLLLQSQRQAEEMASQEEEMRQNMEELQATQEAAERREQELQNILGSIQSAAFVAEFDLDGHITDINSSFLNILNKTKSKVLGKWLPEVIGGDKDSPEFFAFWQAMRGGQSQLKIEQFKIGRREISLLLNYIPISNAENNPIKVMCIGLNMDDVSSLKNQIHGVHAN